MPCLPSHLSARGSASRSDGIDSNGGLAPGRIVRANVRGASVGRHLARSAKVVIGCSARAGGATTALIGHLQSVEFDQRFIGRRLGAFMEDSWKREDKCPNCRDPLEIAQVKFGFNCISFVSACPNCRLVSISRTTEHDKFRLLLSNVARAMWTFVLTRKGGANRRTSVTGTLRRADAL
jgi:hypothetical protein